MALRTIATAATILFVMLPAAAQSQSSAKTECNDGTRTTATGARACDGHGGVHRVHTAILHRAPSGSQSHTREPAGATQAGTPSRESSDHPEEHRGWRWFRRHHDKDDEHAKRHDRVRCRDGRYEDVKQNHGRGRGPEVCKHHGGVAQ